MTARCQPILGVVLVVVLAGAIGAAGGLPQDNKPQTGKQAAEGSKVNLNTASLEELISLPEIGETIARNIIGHREKVGPFRRIEELIVIRLITRRKFEKIRHLITVGEVHPSGEPDPS